MQFGLKELFLYVAIAAVMISQLAGTYAGWNCAVTSTAGGMLIMCSTTPLTWGFPSDYVVIADGAVLVSLHWAWLAISQKRRRLKKR
jgi:hypothetical protein